MGRGRNSKRARAVRHARLIEEHRRRSDYDLTANLEAARARLRELKFLAEKAKDAAAVIDPARQTLRQAEVRLREAKESGWKFLRLRREQTAIEREARAEADVTAARQALAALYAEKDSADNAAIGKEPHEACGLRDLAAALVEILQSRRKERERARLNSLEGKARSSARRHRNADTLPASCPYCTRRLEDPHHDHIVPVARGGLSEPTNLVFVCRVCNQSKRDLTLLQFCRKEGISFEDVVARLEALGKVV